jgi:isopentenyl diphosphate isomerase/L-lactate dehydrogenase-like FMN-dependent dehydrogenase
MGQAEGDAEPVAVLPAISEAVAGRIPLLVDGGFRRGSDVLKAIALGATAALVCRPVLWGLAAYGAPGAQKVVEMLQSELARDMVQVGAVNLAAIRRDHIRVHSR